MFELIIDAMPSLVKFFEKLKLPLFFSKPQIRHLQGFIVAMMMRGFGGKITDVAELALYTHRTCIGRFLASDGWDDEHLISAIQKHVIDTIWRKSRQTKKPIYIIFDDTICEKAVPLSRVDSPIYGCGFHRSHLKNKAVYGQQFVGCMLRCGDLVLPFGIVLYEKQADKKAKAKTKSKIDIAREIIESLPPPPHEGFVLTDSWYSCKDLFDAARNFGYHFIGGIKSNRLIFPRCFRKKGIKIGKFVQSLKPSDCDLVTVKGKQKYHVYTYLGKINGQRKVKIIITWPAGSFGNPKRMRIFISTDIKMNPKQLIAHYMKRWPIEVFFREANRHLGMKQCQVRSKKAIMRYQYILMLGYIFCGMKVSGGKIVLGSQRREHRQAIERAKIAYAFEQGQNGGDLTDVFGVFKVAG